MGKAGLHFSIVSVHIREKRNSKTTQNQSLCEEQVEKGLHEFI